MEYGNCEATALAPSVTPERLRKVRRSMVLPSTLATFLEIRVEGVDARPDFLVSSIAVPLSDPSGAVILVDVFRDLVTTA